MHRTHDAAVIDGQLHIVRAHPFFIHIHGYVRLQFQPELAVGKGTIGYPRTQVHIVNMPESVRGFRRDAGTQHHRVAPARRIAAFEVEVGDHVKPHVDAIGVRFGFGDGEAPGDRLILNAQVQHSLHSRRRCGGTQGHRTFGAPVLDRQTHGRRRQRLRARRDIQIRHKTERHRTVVDASLNRQPKSGILLGSNIRAKRAGQGKIDRGVGQGFPRHFSVTPHVLEPIGAGPQVTAKGAFQRQCAAHTRQGKRRQGCRQRTCLEALPREVDTEFAANFQRELPLIASQPTGGNSQRLECKVLLSKRHRESGAECAVDLHTVDAGTMESGREVRYDDALTGRVEGNIAADFDGATASGDFQLQTRIVDACSAAHRAGL